MDTRTVSTRVADFVSLYNRKLLAGCEMGKSMSFVVVPLQWERPSDAAIALSKEKERLAEDEQPNSAQNEQTEKECPIQTTSTTILSDCLTVIQNIETNENGRCYFDMVISIMPSVAHFGPKDIDVSYSESTCEFFVSADEGRIAQKVSALGPIMPASITAKASKSKRNLKIRANLVSSM